MTTINGLPISNVLVSVLLENTHTEGDVVYTSFETFSDQIVELTYMLIEQLDSDGTPGEIDKIKGFLINLGYMREAFNNLNFAIIEGYKPENNTLKQ